MAAPETIERLQESASEAFALLAGMQLEVFTHLADGPGRLSNWLARSEWPRSVSPASSTPS